MRTCPAPRSAATSRPSSSPTREPADVEVALTARQQKVSIPGGPTLTAYTLNGTTARAQIRARRATWSR